MSIRLNKAIRELNIGLQTAVEFLEKRSDLGEVRGDLNFKLSDEQYGAFVDQFKKDKEQKGLAEKLYPKKQKEKKQRPEPKVETVVEQKQQFKPLGKIDLSSLGKKPEPVKAEPPAPAAEPEPKAAAESPKPETKTVEKPEPVQPEQVEQPVEESVQEEQTPNVEELEARIAELEDKNLRMMAEFDNYRRRTNKEKLDLMATAGERIFTDMLPLVDDFERALAVIDDEGVRLIYNKFLAFLDKNDVHPIETEGVDFNTDEHEAVTTFAAGEDQKGKVIDCTQKGYKLGDKVIRFAKVVVGE